MAKEDTDAVYLAVASPRPSQHVPTPTSTSQMDTNATYLESAVEWLDRKASAITRSEFGDIDMEAGDDDDYNSDQDEADLEAPSCTRSVTNLNSTTPPLKDTTVPTTTITSGSPSKPRRKALASRLKIILDDQTLFSMYKRLMYLALATNITLLCLLCTGYWTAAQGKAPLLAVTNVFLCVLFRNEAFFRIVYWITVKALAHAWVPVHLKWWVTSFLQSVGGLHSGCGMASVLWMVKALYDMSGNAQLATDAMVALGYTITALLSVSCIGAFPVVRHLFHDTFEFSHRTAGWANLACLWAFVILAARHNQTSVASTTATPPMTLRDTLETMPEYWLAVGLTVLVVLPWLSVRRVRVEFENPSAHASLIRFPGPVRAGYLGRISRSLLGDWHAFGIISDNRFTHTILAGAVGDFTNRLVRDRPQYLYTRSVKFAGLPYLIHMYQRVLLVATGSGLCPFLSFLLQDTYPDVFVIWVGKNLRQNFGDEIIAGVEAYPADKRIVRDTAIHSRPNILELTLATAKAHAAEVVIVTSNPVGTREIVNGCRRAGVAAFGPIWDS